MSTSPRDNTPETFTESSGGPSTPSSKKRVVKTRTPRPDELSRETFEFIAAVDDYKRSHMRSFLDDLEILNILYSLGYEHPEFTHSRGDTEEDELGLFQSARKRYRDEAGRLFPSWSELFTILTELGYSRGERIGEETRADPAA